MKDEKISVIIPAYNIENEISRCLKSVLNQTYKNIEIVVVDDGSTDKTYDTITSYAQKYSNLIVIHQENQGVFCARLNGIRKATGDWIGFVDGDDEIEEDMYEVLMKNALDYHADISHCGYQMIFPDRIDLYYGTRKIVLQDHLTGLMDLLKGEFVEPGLWNKLFKKTLVIEVLEEVSLDTSIKINEDLLLNYYLFNKSERSVYLDQCFYHYMIRKNSAATSKISKHKLEDPCKVMKTLLKETSMCKETELNMILRERYIRQLINIATMSLEIDPELIRPYRRQARKNLRKEVILNFSNYKIKKKFRLMMVFATLFPNIYMLIHSFYEHVTGLDIKYDIN